jgi:hypothetical protein
MSQNETKTFDCDLNNTNLFSCILKEVGEKDLNTLSSSTEDVQNKTFVNCLNASLVNCLRLNKEELDFPKVKLQLARSGEKSWLIKQINIIVDKKLEDNLIFERINQCLKFVKHICKTGESIKFSIINLEIKENLKHYKVQLKEINQLLDQVREDKSKKESLFTLFRDMALNK